MTGTATDDADISIANAPDRHRYEVRDAGITIGFTAYRITDDGGSVDFVHTEVDDAYAGRGLAAKLVAFALADVRDSGRRIVPHCAYVAGWIDRHPEYQPITDRP